MLRFRQRIAATARGLRGDGRGWMLAVIAVGWLLILGVRFLVPALLPQVKSTFGVDNTTAGVAVTAVWAFYALTQFPAGLITDRVGERVALTVSLSVSAGSLVLLFGSPVFALFVLGAAAFGIGSGMYGPARGTSLSKGFPQYSGAAFGLILATGSLGSAAIPFAAGVAVVGVVTLVAVPLIDGRAMWMAMSPLLGARMGIAPVANSYVIETLPDEAQGASWGFLRMCFFLVGATGSIFVGAMADRNLFDEAFLVLAALTAVTTVFFALLIWNKR